MNKAYCVHRISTKIEKLWMDLVDGIVNPHCIVGFVVAAFSLWFVFIDNCCIDNMEQNLNNSLEENHCSCYLKNSCIASDEEELGKANPDVCNRLCQGLSMALNLLVRRRRLKYGWVIFVSAGKTSSLH